jgi:hypothetical protein
MIIGAFAEELMTVALQKAARAMFCCHSTPQPSAVAFSTSNSEAAHILSINTAAHEQITRGRFT